MYSKRPNLVIGFHGCDKSVRDSVASGKTSLRKSENDYDWLGHGIYFWENNYERALEYAKIIKDNPERCKSQITTPSVLGAIIDLGYCLDLIDSFYLKLLKEGYKLLLDNNKIYGLEIPKNLPVQNEKDLLIRKLDCAVIETIHQFNKEQDKEEFHSVRGVFLEGNDLYLNAGFKEKNHIQICVRNLNCIKGYFIPRIIDSKYPLP